MNYFVAESVDIEVVLGLSHLLNGWVSQVISLQSCRHFKCVLY